MAKRANTAGLVQIENYDESDFIGWIESDESGYSDVSTEYKEAREYYEDLQIPSASAKAKIEFVQENLITDLINGLVGQLIGGEISPVLTGGGPMGIPLKELVMDIIERNMFMEKHVEPITNLFYCEGLSGIYTIFNPYRLSQYGIGMPEIYTMLPGEFLLDTNSKGFMREDDIRRTAKKRALVQYAEAKYPKLKGNIKATSKSRSGRSGETEDWCDIYTIEFRVPDVVTINDLADGNLKQKLLAAYDSTTKIEVENFYQTVMINKKEQAEEPALTGFNRFRMIPVIHTPRLEDSTYPFGVSKLMKGKQDQINVTGTVALDAVKADIKNLLVLINADPDLEAKYRREASKTNGVIVIEGENASAMQMQRQGISPAVLQWYEWQRRAFDEVIGRYAPEKGAVEEGLSGKAIGLLQARGTVPELTKKLHLEYAFTQMALVILECIGHKMNQQQFSIVRNIDGEEQTMYYNMPMKNIKKLTGEDKLNVVTNNIVNDLTKIDIDEVDLSINVEMDMIGRESHEQNKALVANRSGLLSRQDTTKKLYPKEWREIIENVEKENAAMALLSKIMKLAPDQLQMIGQQAENVDQFVQQLDQLQQSGGNGSVTGPQVPGQ
jgi:hypothetical protein